MAQGEVRYKLTADNKEFRTAFTEAQGQTENLSKSFAEKLGPYAAMAAAAVAALTTAAYAVGAALEKALEQADKLSNMSAKTGLTAESLQKLSAVGLTTGTSMETLGGAVNKMQKVLVETPGTFDRMGLSASALIAMKPEDAFSKIAEKIGSIENPAQRTAAAIAAFGKTGAELLPLMTTNIAAVSLRAQELGLVMSDKVVSSLDEVGDQLDLTKAAAGAVATNLGSVIGTAPGVQQAVMTMGNAFGMLSKAILDNKGPIQTVTTMLSEMAIGSVNYVINAFTILGSVAMEKLRAVVDGISLVTEAFSKFKQGMADVASGAQSPTQFFNSQVASMKGVVTGLDQVKDRMLAVNFVWKDYAALLDKSDPAQTMKGSYRGAADAAKALADAQALLNFQIESAKEGQKRTADFWKEETRVADAYGKSLLAIAQTSNRVQDLMSQATMTGAQKRIAALDQELAKQLFNISQLQTKDATAKAQMSATATAAYNIMKNAAQGYYDSASQFAEANGFKTRAELQQSVDNAVRGYQQMLASGLFTDAELKRSHAAMIKAQDDLNNTHTLSTMEKFDLIANAAHSLIKSIFGKSKAGAIAMAVVDTAQAVVKTLAAYPWPWSLIPAAAVAVAGAVEISKIKSQDTGFAKGTPGLGFMDFGAGTQTVLHGREAVVPESRAKDFARMHGDDGGGGPQMLVIPISIGSERLDKIVLKRTRGGFMQIAAGAVV